MAHSGGCSLEFSETSKIMFYDKFKDHDNGLTLVKKTPLPPNRAIFLWFFVDYVTVVSRSEKLIITELPREESRVKNVHLYK